MSKYEIFEFPSFNGEHPYVVWYDKYEYIYIINA